ncbi:flagellar biosynthesis protein FlhB [Thermosulfurimonas sp. F29]|uniref:flagellar biosynthesis protein FlhB n=1 Tax=Thermosulfurimonas sp. F29 TaxID=2867247 RepID=UPI001C82C4FF|nr:flagellar biosynthesis protein FlhB [Thermosulfurimonas sp. F29]MBX6423603.1 flagellar biosynthesis protein FlhB [Thermosulfurimonas sp. F29]
MPEETLQERTEEPTPRRREEARKRGQVARSREVASVAVLGGSVLGFILAGGFLFLQIRMALEFFLGIPFRTLELPEAYLSLKYALEYGALGLAPFLLIVTLVAFLAHFLQTGGVAAWEALAPKAERINPVEGFKRLFSLPALVELVKSLAKIVIISTVAYLVIRKKLEFLLNLTGEDLRTMAAALYFLSRDLVLKLLMALAVLAVLDFFFQRWDVERKLRMTREELKEELKQTEGDPLVRSRIRQLQREMARRRMMAEVPKADVVITNPEHVAVALRYEIGKMPAPELVAKGQGLLAQKIKEVAREAGVPVVEDPPLARLIYARVEVGEYIPEDLYQAVAEVLAYVYRLKGKRIS